jgi:GMP synthase-like glutamine amidotransferase
VSRRPRLWVIDPSTSTPEDEGVATILDGWEGDSRLFRPALSPGDGPTPESGYDTDGVVLMGAAASVHDSLDWLTQLHDWLSPILNGEVAAPLLGICYGHQAVAHCAGGEVGFVRDDRTKRVGVETSELHGGRLLPGESKLRVVVSHREEVKSCPAGYRVTGSRGPIRIDGLEHLELPVFSFQFHPEAGKEFAARAGIPEEQIDRTVRDDTRRLLGAFRSLIVPGDRKTGA